MKYGMKVTATIVREDLGTTKKEVFRNVTEVHYRYPSLEGERVAFESDCHGTGCTYSLEPVGVLWVKEFEVVPETELADSF